MAKRTRKFKVNKSEAAAPANDGSFALVRDSAFKNFRIEQIGGLNGWVPAGLTVMIIAFLLRLSWLGLKPFHQDEGVNGVFLGTLLRDGVYKYDPSNYHGPTLYFFALLSSYVFGLNEFGVRIVTAVFGILMIAMVLSLRRYLGTAGALFAGLLVAISPGLSFISRYFIHEILFLFFTLGVVVCVLKFIEGERPGLIANALMSILLFVCVLPAPVKLPPLVSRGDEDKLFVARFLVLALAVAIVYFIMRLLLRWSDGLPIYLLLAAASAMLTFATKETAFISFGTMLIAVGCVSAWTKFIGGSPETHLIRRRATVVLHLGLFLIAIYFREDLWNGCLWFYNTYFVNSANKEQPLVLIAIILLLIASIAVWLKYLTESWSTGSNDSSLNEPSELSFHTFVARLGDFRQSTVLLLCCLTVFAFVGILFFSSFFTYREGVRAGFEAYNIWTKTGTKDHTQNGLWYYLKLLFNAEAAILILGALGSLIAFWKAKHRFAMFAALWAFGLFAAYTLIPYKTPWLAINFVLPMALIAGYAINELVTSGARWQIRAAAVLTVLSIGIGGYQTIQDNFFRYDDDSRPYVYAHTRRSLDEMVRVIDRIAERAGTGKQASIIIASPEHWPLAWSLRDYKYPGFFGTLIDAPNAEAIIGSTNQSADLEKKYSATHKLVGTYSLRPGVDLMLYVRKDLVTK